MYSILKSIFHISIRISEGLLYEAPRYIISSILLSLPFLGFNSSHQRPVVRHLQSTRSRCLTRVVWYTFTGVSENDADSVFRVEEPHHFYPEAEGNTFLWIIAKCLWDYMAGLASVTTCEPALRVCAFPASQTSDVLFVHWAHAIKTRDVNALRTDGRALCINSAHAQEYATGNYCRMMQELQKLAIYAMHMWRREMKFLLYHRSFTPLSVFLWESERETSVRSIAHEVTRPSSYPFLIWDILFCSSSPVHTLQFS
jgi:hypothetical protein